MTIILKDNKSDVVASVFGEIFDIELVDEANRFSIKDLISVCLTVRQKTRRTSLRSMVLLVLRLFQ